MTKTTVLQSLVYLFITLFLIPAFLAQCPQECKCTKDQKDITCTGAAQFPTLPKSSTKVTIKDSSFTEITNSSLSGLTNLTELIIDACNQLTTIEPGLFVNLTNLTSFHLKNAPALVALDNDTLKGASGLDEFKLENTSVSKLYGKLFGDTSSLKFLVITGKTVEGVTSETYMNLGQLETLTLTNSAWNSIPPKFFNTLTSLQNLILSDNKLTKLEVEAFSGLTNLAQLNLEGNELKDIPAGIFLDWTLAELDLSQNKFESIPVEALNDLKEVQTLSLSQNNITKIAKDTFAQIKGVKYLYLDKNTALTTLESQAFSNLNNLETLSLTENTNLKVIPPDTVDHPALSNVKILHLHSNGLISLDSAIFTSKPSLQQATIYGNNFTCDCAVLGLRTLMSDDKKYNYTVPWQKGPLAAVCEAPVYFKDRLLFDLNTTWDLACDKPIVISSPPALINVTNGEDVSLVVLVASVWSVTTNWTNPSGEVITPPYASHAQEDAIAVNQIRLVNGTISVEYKITKVTSKSQGSYTLNIHNQNGTFTVDIDIQQVTSPPVPNPKLGSIEIMVIIIGIAIGLLIGLLVIGIHHKQKKLYETRRRDEERQGLLAGSYQR